MKIVMNKDEQLRKDVLSALTALKAGNYNPVDKLRFDPEVSGQGVSISALRDHFPDTEPDDMIDALTYLIADGKIEELPDTDQLPTFNPL